VSYLPDTSQGLSLPQLARVDADRCWQDSALDTGTLQRLAAERQEFAHAATRVIGVGAAALDLTIAETERQRIQRLRQEQDLFLLKKNLDKADAEVAGLNHKAELLETEAVRAEAQSAAAAQRLQHIEERLQPLTHLEQAIQQEQSIKDRHVEDHRSYLGARPQADQLLARRAALDQAARGEGEAREAVRLRTEEFNSANREFNVAALETSRAEAASAATALAMAEQAQTQADQELKRERERFGQWQEACAARERVSRELNRLDAAAELAKFAGRILKLSAPAVAQHLCSRIAMQAQRLFNEIHPDPIELEWNAEPSYGLRISPGDRRFAMLSGGEQTKLALAMTLAMIHAFSSLRFAVFDEPTYAVDADSRAKLADAIVAAQKAAGLEQLILVSHDDTFEGYIENVVLLRK
jgi:exonuclease SbcC